MAKIIRLTESDLTRIVRRVIREQREEGEEDLKNLEGVEQWERTAIMLRNAPRETIDKILRNVPEKVKFIAIFDSEYAEINSYRICADKLCFINLKGTPNNMKELIENDMFECEVKSNNGYLYEFPGSHCWGPFDHMSDEELSRLVNHMDVILRSGPSSKN